MGRKLRTYLPGVPFHLTSRLQGGVPGFEGLERAVEAAILRSTRRSDGRLLAFAVMPNHIHVVYVQGELPLSAYMMPVLRSLAHLMHRYRGTRGHAFERRFRAHACLDPDYLRNAIAYVHLNRVRAGLAASAAVADPSSHRWYVGGGLEPPPYELHWYDGLRCFAVASAGEAGDLSAAYQIFLRKRLDLDRWLAESEPLKAGTAAILAAETASGGPSLPQCLAGDRFWSEAFGPSCHALPWQQPRERPDLRDVGLRFLQYAAPDLTLDDLRSGGRKRRLVAVRRAFIQRARQVGHTCAKIAAFLRISRTAVSRIAPAELPVPWPRM